MQVQHKSLILLFHNTPFYQVFDVDMVDHSFQLLKRRNMSSPNPSFLILPVLHTRDESSVGI